MTYKTHLSTAWLFSSVIFLFILEAPLSLMFILLIIISTSVGASAPDLDTPSGQLWKKIPAGSFLGRVVNPIFIGGHRHLSHSFLGCVILALLYWLLLSLVLQIPTLEMLANFRIYIFLAFLISYLSHLFGDLFTEMGVPLLFPLGYHFGIPPDPFGKMRIKTGKWFENLVIYPTINLGIIIIIVIYLKKIL